MGTLAAHNGGLIGAFHDADSCERENPRLESKMLALSSQIFFDKAVVPVDNFVQKG
jgi:hypothetical protein